MPTALVLEAADRFELAERPLPQVQKGQVLVRVIRVGLCGTDLHIVDGHHPRASFPLALGHEMVGRLAGADDGGPLVVIDPLVACGTCVACLMGERHVCTRLRLIGIDSDGGLAGFVAVDADRVHPVAADVGADIAVLAEPLAVAVHAVRRAAVAPDETVVIMGAGPIGLLLAFVARRAGAGRIVVSERSPTRRAVALAFGLETLGLDHPSIDFAERTGGRLADVAFDAAGVPAVAAILSDMVRPAGRIALVGVYGRPAEVDLQAIVFREQTILGNRVYTPGDIDAALGLLRDDGEPVRALISETVRPSGVAAAFERIRAGRASKVVVALEGA